MEALANISGFIVLFLIIAGILFILLPFFVLRIRRETIEINKNIKKILLVFQDQAETVLCDKCKKEVPKTSIMHTQAGGLCGACFSRSYG